MPSLEDVPDIVEKATQGVVMIRTVAIAYDIFLNPVPVPGIGSGFVVSKGYIVTNAHVVGELREVNVVYFDGRKELGRVIARDPYKDLALIRIERRDVKPLKLGDSDSLRIGEIVFAIGSPLGLGPTVTMGVVSGIGRTIEHERLVLEDLIQTDAAINPGNSGGPLINLRGEVVGVVTAIVPYAQGIGFAIPINTVKRFIELVSKFGKAVRAWIGVYTTSINPQLASLYDLPVTEGLLVVRVVPGSPAYEMGIRAGDIIVEANGEKVTRISDLRKAVENSIDRGYVELKIVRDKTTYRLKVPIAIEKLD